MNPNVRAGIDGCRAADARLLVTLSTLTDSQVRQPSLLPGWTVGHVLTHLARNADSHVRRLEGARRDEVMDQYVGGVEGRAADIEAGAGRPASELVDDVRESAAALDAAWSSLPDEAWGRSGRAVSGNTVTMEALVFSRWREVEIHHADLGLGFGYQDWSDGLVAVELPRMLATVPARLTDAAARRQLCAWLWDRTPEPGPMTLDSTE